LDGRHLSAGILIVALAPAILVGGLYTSARAATAHRVGGPLWFSEQTYGSLDRARPELWLGCGFANASTRPIQIASIDVIPACALASDVQVVEC